MYICRLKYLCERRIIALKNDSANAFDDLFRMYGQKLFLFSRGFLKDPDDAKEIVQNVFVKIWENRANIDEFQSFKSYLFSIAYNSIITEFRKKHREQKLLENIKHISAENCLKYKLVA